MEFLKLVLAFVDLIMAVILFLVWRETKSRATKNTGGTLCLLFIANMILLWI